jgi:hypothetical protein
MRYFATVEILNTQGLDGILHAQCRLRVLCLDIFLVFSSVLDIFLVFSSVTSCSCGLWGRSLVWDPHLSLQFERGA